MTIWRQKQGTTEFHVDSTKTNNSTTWSGTIHFKTAHGTRVIDLPEPYVREYYTDTGIPVGEEVPCADGLVAVK